MKAAKEARTLCLAVQSITWGIGFLFCDKWTQNFWYPGLVEIEVAVLCTPSLQHHRSHFPSNKQVRAVHSKTPEVRFHIDLCLEGELLCILWHLIKTTRSSQCLSVYYTYYKRVESKEEKDNIILLFKVPSVKIFTVFSLSKASTPTHEGYGHGRGLHVKGLKARSSPHSPQSLVKWRCSDISMYMLRRGSSTKETCMTALEVCWKSCAETEEADNMWSQSWPEGASSCLGKTSLQLKLGE